MISTGPEFLIPENIMVLISENDLQKKKDMDLEAMSSRSKK